VIHVTDAAGLQDAIQSAVAHIVVDDEISWMPIKLEEGQRLSGGTLRFGTLRVGACGSQRA
jgi:hypothetical protein